MIKSDMKRYQYQYFNLIYTNPLFRSFICGFNNNIEKYRVIKCLFHENHLVGSESYPIEFKLIY